MITKSSTKSDNGSRTSMAPPSYVSRESVQDDESSYAPSEYSGGSAPRTTNTEASAHNCAKRNATYGGALPGTASQSYMYTTNYYNNCNEDLPLVKNTCSTKPDKWVLPWGNNFFKFLLAIFFIQLSINFYLGNEVMSIIHPEQLETMRQQWKIEMAAHDRERKVWDIERKAFELEREEIERAKKEIERELEEQRRREEQERLEREERIRLGLYWDEVQGSDHCYASGTREYTARLMNLPSTYDGLKGCRSTPITIHDVTIDHPYKCENRGFFDGIYGHFLVKSGEIACSPYWGAFIDKGCTAEGSHTQRIESRLLNISPGENWKQMCSTTPADFRGLHFEGPQYCNDIGIWGVYGVWEVENSAC